MDCFFSNKNKYVRLYIVILGLLVLFLLNSFLVIYFLKPDSLAYVFLLLLILWYIYWSKYNFFRSLKYCIDWKGIYIIYWKKTFFIPFKEIKFVAKFNPNFKFFKIWWLKYDFLNKITYFTTSTDDLYIIYLQNWKKIVISPKQEFLNFLNKYVEVKNEN